MGSMINEWLWFLLFVAIASAWLLLKTKNDQGKVSKSGSSIPPEYLKGLDFLLDQKHDKATELFIKLIEVDSDTVETHFVLGNLFRQKGEIERAIRIHQNITDFPRLSRYYKARALLELGRDYFSAGLFDRAEEFFKQALLVDINSIKLETYPYLLSLYETEKNWWQAIKVAEKLKNKRVGGYLDRISHYYCELAEQSLTRREYDDSQTLLVKAKLHNETSMRVMAIEGDLDFERGRIVLAERRYLKAFAAYPQYAKFLLPKILKTIKLLDSHELSDYLGRLRPKISSTTYLLAFCKSLLDANRASELEALYSELIKQRCIPLSVVRLYLEYKANSCVSDKQLITGIIESLSANEHTGYSYQCAKCGFEAHRLYWQCPSCRSWSRAYPEDVLDQPDSEDQSLSS